MAEPPENRLARLFESVVDLPVGDRAAFMDAACGADAVLRAKLQRLVDAHEASGDFLPQNPKSTRVSPKPCPDALNSGNMVGTNIGPYRLLEQIGEGGWGIVYVAEQRVPVRRRVALKLIKQGMDSKALIARFESERQAVALMEHPNIAKFLDAGTTPLGHPYFVMELVRGTPITDFCDQARLTTRERLELFVDVCRAVQHAHQKGVIHRDIKPSNILVTLQDGKAVPKIIDFGIAKATHGSLVEATVYTQFHQFIGTPAYMSPEQAEMTSLDIDTRTDIYSLGVLLYELLTGQPPFDPKELMAAGLDAMRKTIREKDPARPSTRLSTLLNAELALLAHRRNAEPPRLVDLVRGDLDWIAMRCLEKDRSRRYETANGLASDIVRHLNNEPVLARPPSAWYQMQKAYQRNRGYFIAGTMVVIALILGTSVSVWQAIRAAHGRDKAEQLGKEAAQAAKEAKAEAARGKAEATFIKSMFEDMVSVIDENNAKIIFKLLDRIQPGVDSKLELYPEVRADIGRIIGHMLVSSGDYQNGKKVLGTALANREICHAPEDLDEAEIRLWLGTAARETDHLDVAVEEYSRALRIRQNLLGHDNELVAQVLGALGTAIGRMPGPPSAPLANLQKEENLLREALEIEEKAAKNMRIKNGLLGGAARNKSDQGKWEDSLRLLDQALAIVAPSSKTNQSQYAATLAEKARILGQSGRLDEAVAGYRDVVQDMTQRLGVDNKIINLYRIHLADFLDIQGKCAEAEPLRRDALKFSGALSPAKSVDHCLFYARLGRTLLFEGKLAEAEVQFREELRLREKSGDLRSDATRNALNRIGSILLAEGRVSDAELVFKDALDRYRSKTPPTKRQDECQYFGQWADTLWRQGKFDAAEQAIAEVVPRDAAALKPDDAYAYALRASFCARAHRWEETRKDLERAVKLNPEDAAIRHGLAALYLQQGDLDAMKRVVSDGVTLLGETYDSQVAAQVCLDYALVPGSPMDARIDKLVWMAGSDGFLPYWTWLHIDWFDLYPLARGLVLYREGHYESAADWAGKAAAIPSLDPNRPAQGLILQAMAQQQLGHPIEAMATLDRAESLMKAKAPALNSPDLGDHWADIIVTHTLLHEAHQLFQAEPGSKASVRP